jgi:glutamate synthase (NADPH/NADH) large chain
MTGGRAIVLGRTGRNFAAGMSGGIAYVLDLDHDHINLEMVELEPLDDEDRAYLRDIVARHHTETGSTVAAGLLAGWAEAVGRFGKIMPRDYKRVLTARARAEAEGRDIDEAVMAASNG